jgi:hypothetical protein
MTCPYSLPRIVLLFHAKSPAGFSPLYHHSPRLFSKVQLSPFRLHHTKNLKDINMAGSVGKLSRGSLSYNKSYKPNGLKAYARAALKCLYLSDFWAEASTTDSNVQTTLVLRLRDRFVLSRKLGRLGSLDTTRLLVARPVSMVMY